MRITRTIKTATPLAQVFDYLSDFTSTNEWDPGTVNTTLVSGDGGPGTVYHNVSRFLGRETELDYTVTERVDGHRLVLRGVNKTVEAVDTMVFTADPDGGTTVVYDADFGFRGITGKVAPLLLPVLALAFKRLGDEAETGMQRELDRLEARR
jgi:uncharacterized protein YndB with AHSA1/START domain